jgi:hypothetical protein
MSDLKAVVDELLAAAVAWYQSKSNRVDEVDCENDLYRAVAAYQAKIESMEPPGPRADQARPMTWSTVPAGWYVKAPDGRWYEVIATRSMSSSQLVTMSIAGRHLANGRDPEGPVTACPGPPNATDAAIEALGFPQILEDGA